MQIEVKQISSFAGLSMDQAIKFACQMGFGPHCVEPSADFFVKLYNFFIEKDCTLLEINPLTEISTGEGNINNIYFEDGKENTEHSDTF